MEGARMKGEGKGEGVRRPLEARCGPDCVRAVGACARGASERVLGPRARATYRALLTQ